MQDIEMSPVELEIRRMFNALPPRADTDKAELIRTFLKDTACFAPEIVIEACERFRFGKAGNGKRAPLEPEFIAECEDRAEIARATARLERQREAATKPRGPSPYEVAQERLKVEMAGRPILAKNVSLDEFRKQCRAKAWPVDTCWKYGTVYGPVEQV